MMEDRHPSFAQLLEYRRGRGGSSGLGHLQWLNRHLQTCSACRALVRDERLLEALLGRESRRRPGPGHPDEATLAAYHDEALPRRRMERIAGHLAGCGACLQTLLDIRRMIAQAAPRPVPEALAREVRAAIPRRAPAAGRLAVALSGDRVNLSFLPAVPWPSAGPSPSVSADLVAERRAGRSDPGRGYEAGRETTRIRVPGYRLELVGFLLKQVMLHVRVLDAGTGAPAAGLVLALEQDARADEAVTGDDGETVLRVPPGVSRLRIGANPGVEVDLFGDDPYGD